MITILSAFTGRFSLYPGKVFLAIQVCGETSPNPAIQYGKALFYPKFIPGSFVDNV